MTIQRLDRTLFAYRIGDPMGEFPIFDANGSKIAPGRWNDPAAPMIYASEHYSTAMLEKLAHADGLMPPNQHYIEITLPVGTSFEILTKDHLPGWDRPDPVAARAYGSRWLNSHRSCLLMVPSIVARMEHNILINPEHPDKTNIDYSLPTPIWWDRRLFASET